MSAVSLYQMGILKHLSDPPLPSMNSDKVDASGEAYVLGSTPDSTLAIASYAVTLALAGMGPADRAEQTPWVALALAGKVVADAAGAILLTAEQVTKHKALCFYCVTAAAAETRIAVAQLVRRRT